MIKNFLQTMGEGGMIYGFCYRLLVAAVLFFLWRMAQTLIYFTKKSFYCSVDETA